MTASEPHDPTPSEAGAVALVGMACRLPGAADPDTFWRLLAEGGDAVGQVPPSRWAVPPEVAHVRHGGFLDEIDRFDPGFFGISPREAAAVDPQQRLMLELAWEAFENAGIVPAHLRGTSTGVFVGAIWDDYATLARRRGAAITQHTLTGQHRGLIANRISFSLGLRGPSVTVDSAQSSGLVAVHAACESILRGESVLALAGGVNLNLVPDSAVAAARFGGLSPDGRSYTFDARANGYVRGEGGGIVLLKPLAAALADGDPVYCVIRGSAVNNDGDGAGLTVPNVAAQREVLRLAYARAGVAPGEVGYVELHGTGTPVGDPIEAAALGAELGSPGGVARERPLLVASAKTNVGHLEGAAGIVGLIKAALAVHHRAIPASLNFSTPNPDIPLDELGLRVPVELTPWPTGAALVAGVSSFGMGGTNCHVVLSEPPHPPAPGPSAPVATGRLLPFTVSGRTGAALRAQAGRLAAVVETDDPPLGALATSLVTTRTAFEHRAVVLARSRDELRARLTDLAEGRGGTDVVTGRTTRAGKVAVLFSGQGSQRAGMGRELYETEPEFAAAVDEIAEHLDPHLTVPVRALLLTADEDVLAETDHAQAALFAVEVALDRLARHHGLVPDYLIGHSLGEIVAAHIAGVLSLPDACRLVAARGTLMRAARAGGAMVSVDASEEAVRASIGGYGDAVSVAAVNTPSATVVSGDEDAVLAVAEHWRALGHRTRRLRVGHAFHSAHMDGMLTRFRAVVTGLTFHEPSLPVISNVTGAVATADQLSSPDYWVAHVRGTVRFADGVRTLRDADVTTFVELGPDAVLTALVGECLGSDAATATLVSMQRRDRPAARALLDGLAGLHCGGTAVDWSEVIREPGSRVALPTYAFQRERYWLDGADRAPAPVVPMSTVSPTPVRVAADTRTILRWCAPRSRSCSARHTVPRGSGTDVQGTRLRLAVLGGAAAQADRAPAPRCPRPCSTTTRPRPGSPHTGRNCWRTPGPRTHPRSPTRPRPTTGSRSSGMACRVPRRRALPGGPVAAGDRRRRRDRRVPDDRGWDLDRLYHPTPTTPARTYTRHGGFLHDADQFDADVLRHQRPRGRRDGPAAALLLEIAWETSSGPASTRTRCADADRCVRRRDREGYGRRLHAACRTTATC
jgi:acyl transferase domain-containing protein